MNKPNAIENKNAKHKLDVMYRIWLRSMFWNITFIPLSDEEVKGLHDLLGNYHLP